MPWHPIDYLQPSAGTGLGWSRRQVLQGAGAALALASGALRAQTPTNTDISDAAAAQWRAMSRLGYGPSAGLVQELTQAKDPRQWALQQLDKAAQASQSEPAIAADLLAIRAPLPQVFDGVRRERQAKAAAKAESANAANDNPKAGTEQLDFSAPPDSAHYVRSMIAKTQVWRLTASATPAQENLLLARMTEFWFNHLNVYIGKGPVRPFVGHYLIDAIRKHALGSFEDLLLASARHPAMLLYLDQAQSVADGSKGGEGQRRGLNENYARELMELHTLGVDGGYTQTDVRELARTLTGWTTDPRAASGFRFVPRLHDTGSKSVLGQTYPRGWLAQGVAEGEQAIRMLARHPSTARRISLRLARFFVADVPSPALLERLQQTFIATQGNIREMMRTIIESDDFWDPHNRLFKTPMDYACSVLTACESADDRHTLLLSLGFLRNAGQPLHGWQTPDGYPTDAATWLVPEALTRRADFALRLGREARSLDFLMPFLGAGTRDAMARAPAAMRDGLALASPEFMYK